MIDEKLYKYGFYFLFVLLLAIIVPLQRESNKNRDLEYLMKHMNDDKCEKAGGLIFQEKCIDKKIFIEVDK